MQQQAASRILNFELSDNNKAASLSRLFDIQKYFLIVTTVYYFKHVRTKHATSVPSPPTPTRHSDEVSCLMRLISSSRSARIRCFWHFNRFSILSISMLYLIQTKNHSRIFLCIHLISKRNVHFNVIKLGHKLLHYFIAVPSRVIWLVTTGNRE